MNLAFTRAPFFPSRCRLGAILGLCLAVLGRLGMILGPPSLFWGFLRASFIVLGRLCDRIDDGIDYLAKCVPGLHESTMQMDMRSLHAYTHPCIFVYAQSDALCSSICMYILSVYIDIIILTYPLAISLLAYSLLQYSYRGSRLFVLLPFLSTLPSLLACFCPFTPFVSCLLSPASARVTSFGLWHVSGGHRVFIP